MSDFKARVVAEKEELDTKLAALRKFIDTPTFKDLEEGERIRMRAQAHVMREYSQILGERIQAFK